MQSASAKSGRWLYDVNVLIALFDPYHTRHEQALEWHTANAHTGWASCPMTQNGLARIMSQPKYGNPKSIHEMLGVVSQFQDDSSHDFWSDDISIAAPEILDRKVVVTSSMLTDLYLLALAVKHSGCLVTFDTRIPRNAIIGARADHLLVL